MRGGATGGRPCGYIRGGGQQGGRPGKLGGERARLQSNERGRQQGGRLGKLGGERASGKVTGK